MARSKSDAQLWVVGIALALIISGCIQVKEWLFPPEPVTVPNLVGKRLTEAASHTEVLGLKMSPDGVIDSYCPDHDECTIVRMVPSPGATVPPESTVTVRYITNEQAAFYRKHRRMPKVVGWSEERANTLFQPVRETLDADRRETKSVPAGTERVIRQSPKPGTRLRVGQKIKIVIGYNTDYGSGGSGDLHLGDGNGRVNLPNINPCRKSRWC